MLVTIRHKLNDPLAVTLSLIQPQLSENDDIYLIDTTKTREGLDTAKKYGTSRSVIYVEVGEYDKDTSYKFFKEKALKNDYSELLCLDNVLFSTNLVQNIKKALSLVNFNFLSPTVLPNGETLNPNFSWYNRTTKKEDIILCNDYTSNIYCENFKGKGIYKLLNEKVVYL